MLHTPSRYICNNADTAILFVHGIVGSPDQFRELMPLVPPEWSCVNLLLPGHGGTATDFSRASMVQWRSYVSAEVDRLAAAHKRVLLVGHSMGTLFCIDEALHQDRVVGLFLLACPLYPMLTLTATRQSLQVALGIERATPAAQAAKRACSVTGTKKLWQYLGWLPRFGELFQAAKLGREELKQLGTPTVAVHSEKDELVSHRSFLLLEQATCVSPHTLPNAGHFYYPPDDLVHLQALFCDFVKKYR